MCQQNDFRTKDPIHKNCFFSIFKTVFIDRFKELTHNFVHYCMTVNTSAKKMIPEIQKHTTQKYRITEILKQIMDSHRNKLFTPVSSVTNQSFNSNSKIISLRYNTKITLIN
jgi:hypothetical protein